MALSRVWLLESLPVRTSLLVPSNQAAPCLVLKLPADNGSQRKRQCRCSYPWLTMYCCFFKKMLLGNFLEKTMGTEGCSCL